MNTRDSGSSGALKKCDGKVPACSNCAKAGAHCLDVDGRNAEQLIPRSFSINARARIQWLEDVIRTHLPDFDLSTGPKVELSFADGLRRPQMRTSPDTQCSPQRHEGQPEDEMTMVTPAPSNTTSPQDWPQSSCAPAKRPYSWIAESERDTTFSDEARSVAVNFGMLSLNSDSRQTHYLGSSSGLLFARLIGADGAVEGYSHAHTATNSTSSIPNPRSDSSSRQQVKLPRPSPDFYDALYSTLKQDLPPQEDAKELLEEYIAQIHPEHPVLHLPSLLCAVEALYQCSTIGSEFSIGRNGWPNSIQPFAYNGEIDLVAEKEAIPISIEIAAFHVFMVFDLASIIRTHRRIYDYTPARFYRAAMSVSRECFAGTSMASLQCVLLLTVHSLTTPAQVNVWTMVHICMANCIDIGIHREFGDTTQLPAAYWNTRRFVFWSVYSLDRSVASIQGRPLGFRDETFDVEIPAAKDLESERQSESIGFFHPRYSTTATAPYSIHRFKLDRYISEIKLLLYHLPTGLNSFVWPTDLDGWQADMHTRLRDWQAELANVSHQLDQEMPQDECRRLCTKLEVQFHAAMMLLYQPSQVYPVPSEASLSLCFRSASQRLRGYSVLHEMDNLRQSWRSVQSVFASGATMIYCFWTSKAVQESTTLTEMSRDLRICSNLLSVAGEWWPSVKKGKASFEKIVDLTIRKLASLPSGTSGSQRAHEIPTIGSGNLTTAEPSSNMMQNSSFGVGRQHNARNWSAGDLASAQQQETVSAAPYNQMLLAGNDFANSMGTSNAEVDWSSNGESLEPPSEHSSGPENQSARGPVNPTIVFRNSSALSVDGSQYMDPEVEGFLAEFIQGDIGWNFL
ncbi:hypothetical protein B7463_g8221, partial [Scytalidium lignicola]